MNILRSLNLGLLLTQPLLYSMNEFNKAFTEKSEQEKQAQNFIKKLDPVNMQDCDGNTPLHIAVTQDSKEIVELLFQHKAYANITNNQHFTPLHIAIQNNNPEMVSLLLKYGANPNIKMPADVIQNAFFNE
jgi:ankyrin repeat protein